MRAKPERTANNGMFFPVLSANQHTSYVLVVHRSFRHALLLWFTAVLDKEVSTLQREPVHTTCSDQVHAHSPPTSPYRDQMKENTQQPDKQTLSKKLETTTKSHPRNKVRSVDRTSTTAGKSEQQHCCSQKLRPRSKLGLLAEPQPVYAPPGTARPVPPPLLSPRSPAVSTLTPSPPAATISRSPHHLLADLHRGRRVFEGETPRDVAEVKGSDLKHRSAVRGARGVGADVALEGRSRSVQERLVAGHEELQSLLELVRQLKSL